MIIRTERPLDTDSIGSLTSAAFKGMVHSSGTEAAIVDALRREGALALSLVAEKDGLLVGHVAFSPVTIDGKAGGWFGLGPVSVLPAQQRSGTGSALIREGLERLKNSGAEGCIVLGEPAYYQRFGFISDGALRYGDVPPHYLQWLGFANTRPRGEVVYHAGFEAK